MALGRVKGGAEASYALAWIDISTGVFRVAETVRGPACRRYLPRRPEGADRRRAGVPRSGAEAAVRHARPRRQPAAGRACSIRPRRRGRIARFFGVATPDSFGAFSRAELSAISGAIAYVEKTQKAERPPLSRPEREESGATLFIDPATRANLELVRTMSGSRDGSLFKAIDRTVTGAGARLLADRLMAPLTDPAAIDARLDSVAFFAAEPRLARGAARRR